MKQMIQRMREEKGGFTLAELLVVVAIVAVLVAIAIPVFTSSLDKANAQTDAANIRAGYASASVALLDKDTTQTYVCYLNNDGSVTETANGTYICKGDAAKLGDSTTNPEVIGNQNASTINWKPTNHIKYTWTPATTTNGTTTEGSWAIAPVTQGS